MKLINDTTMTDEKVLSLISKFSQIGNPKAPGRSNNAVSKDYKVITDDEKKEGRLIRAELLDLIKYKL